MDITKTETKMNLYQKLVEIRKQVLYVQKDSKGFGTITYASGADIICAIRPKQDELNVILQQQVLALDFVSMQKGTSTISVPKIEVIHTWIDGDNPSDRLVTHDFYFEDKMTGSQCIGAMKTYAERYFLYKFFQVATGADDIEKVYKENGWSNKVEETKPEPKRVTKDPVLVSVVGRGLTASSPECPIHQQHIDEFVTFCRVVLGPSGTQEDIEGFTKRAADFCKGKLAAFEQKLDAYKNSHELLKTDFERSMSRFKKQATSATTIA